jgi:hypothetical protein
MRRLLALAVAVAAAATLAGIASGNVARDPFTGVWIAVENPGDGSTDVMSISAPRAGGARTWLYYETNASGYCNGGPLAAAGTAPAASGDVLTITVKFTYCFNGSPGSFPPPFVVPATATGGGQLVWSGVTFSRAGG